MTKAPSSRESVLCGSSAQIPYTLGVRGKGLSIVDDSLDVDIISVSLPKVGHSKTVVCEGKGIDGATGCENVQAHSRAENVTICLDKLPFAVVISPKALAIIAVAVIDGISTFTILWRRCSENLSS